MNIETYKTALAKCLNAEPQHITLSWKGRVGLYGILKALNVGEGDEVILPAFTCVVVANAIIYLGATPVYCDIDAKTYNADLDKLKAAITPKTKVIIAQNTFGLSSDFDAINAIAHKQNITVIEDCTHGFGGHYKGQPNGTLAKAAFFSSQWNKAFSTGLGGMVIANDPEIAVQLNAYEQSLIEPSSKQALSLKLQIFAKKYLLNKHSYWNALKLYRYLSAKNLVTGSSAGEELSAPVMPDDFCKGFSSGQAKEGIKQLKQLGENLAHRKMTARFYDEVLTEIGITPPYQPDYCDHTFVKYPLLVKDRDVFMQKAEAAKIPLGDWFLSPIHPIEKDHHLWGYSYGAFPVAEAISKHIVNLPTDRSVQSSELPKIKAFLRTHKDDLITFEDIALQVLAAA